MESQRARPVERERWTMMEMERKTEMEKTGVVDRKMEKMTVRKSKK